MPARIEVTPAMRRIISEGRRSEPPRTWKAIADDLGVSLKSAINLAIRAKVYTPTYRRRDPLDGAAALEAAWARARAATRSAGAMVARSQNSG